MALHAASGALGTAGGLGRIALVKNVSLGSGTLISETSHMFDMECEREKHKREWVQEKYGHSQNWFQRFRQRISKANATLATLFLGHIAKPRYESLLRYNGIEIRPLNSRISAAHLDFSFSAGVATRVLPSLAICSLLSVQRRRQVCGRHSRPRKTPLIRCYMVLDASGCRTG